MNKNRIFIFEALHALRVAKLTSDQQESLSNELTTLCEKYAPDIFKDRDEEILKVFEQSLNEWQSGLYEHIFNKIIQQ